MNAPHARLRIPNGSSRAVATTEHEVQIQQFRIEVVNGPNRGHVAVAEADEVTVGTAPTNHLVVTDPALSRHHLAIAATPAGFQLRDLSSSSGTLLAGFRVEVAYIDSGALIQAGDTTFRFDVLDEYVSRQLSEQDRFGDVLGQSAAMRRVFATLEQVAPTDTAVLLDGEAGTGKGALAEAIHRQSQRSSGPFVAVDLSSLSPGSIEGELFGYEPGSAPGVEDQRPGAFGAAEGGTIFLDGVAELSLELQAKLLRALESRQIRRLGSVTPVPVDVRVVASTHRDLRHEVNAGTFRTDLFYRLGAVRVTVPPLRERAGDIPLLVGHFYRHSSPGAAEPPAELLAGFQRQSWPGNVRELRSAVERAALLAPSAAPATAGSVNESWPELDFTISFRESKEGALAVWTRTYVRQLVDRYGGNLSRAARAVSMDRNHLRDLLHKYAMNGANQP